MPAITADDLTNAQRDVSDLAKIVSGAATDPDVPTRTGPTVPPVAKVIASIQAVDETASAARDEALAAVEPISGILDTLYAGPGLPPEVTLDVIGRPLSLVDAAGETLGSDGNVVGQFALYAGLAEAIAALPGATPQLMYKADMLNALGKKTLIRRPICIWDEAINDPTPANRIDSFRFASVVDYDLTHSFLITSARDGAVNDGEDDMKLIGKPITLDANAIPTPGAIVDFSLPPGYPGGSNSSWGGASFIAGDYHHTWFTISNAGRYDIYTMYRRISTGVLSAPRSMLTGVQAAVAFGVPDSGLGYQLVGVNPVAHLDNGRVVIIGYMPGSPKSYLAPLWVDYATLLADPDTYELTPGAALQYAVIGHNEPDITRRQGGGGIVTVRNESTNDRGIYTTDGVNSAYLREEPLLNFTNEANGLFFFDDGVPMTLVAASADAATGGHRQNGAVFLCYGPDLTPCAIVRNLWDPSERIDYMAIWRGANGNPRFLFEHSEQQINVSFNQRVSESWIEVTRPWLLANSIPLF